jgi:hypothetical protein
VRSKPFRTCKMRLPHVVCSSWFPNGINAEHDNRGFIPLGSVCVSVDETAIGDDVIFVIVGQGVRAGRLVGNEGGKNIFAHGSSGFRAFFFELSETVATLWQNFAKKASRLVKDAASAVGGLAVFQSLRVCFSLVYFGQIPISTKKSRKGMARVGASDANRKARRESYCGAK